MILGVKIKLGATGSAVLTGHRGLLDRSLTFLHCQMRRNPVIFLKTLKLMSRYLSAILTTSLALGFSACETTKTETVTTTHRVYEGQSEENTSGETQNPTPKPTIEQTETTAGDVPPVNVEPSVTPMPTPVVQDYPTAASVEGKPGFVKSPFGGSGIVDVRGYPPGTEVKDPYTGKVFLVP